MSSVAQQQAMDQRRLRRGDLTAFIARHHVVWEMAMGVLAVGYLVAGFLFDTGDVASGPWPVILFVLGGIFFVEFTARFLDAPSRGWYLRHHWLDLVSIIPLIGGLRALRLLRLLRLGAALKVLTAAEEATSAHGHTRTSVWYVAPVLMVLWFGAACAIWSLEHDVNPSVKTFGDALYWAFISTMTIGYGNATPVTAAGHILAGLLVFLGVGLVGFASARLTQVWLRDESQHHPRLMLEKMTRLEQEMESLKEVILAERRRDEPAEPARSGGAADR
ncbi:MAG: potassium channel family protein [Candidatus Dormibacteria bacterium]